jgi:L,D-peptidoglycan transpeptidase YkuD (ErfK/YbiS/YcfS/YnhG family)
MIHGVAYPFFWAGKLHRLYDWTDGCVAVSNYEMSELWRAVRVGTPITLEP